MRRRDLIALAVGAALRPIAGLAQAQRVRRLGVLGPFDRAAAPAVAQALGRLGWEDGSNLQTDYRFVGADSARYKRYAAELIGLSPDVVLAGGTPAVTALRPLTSTIPIVFVFVGDPVGQGFVQSLARPGGNITGFASPDMAMVGKWLQLLKDTAPGTTRVAVLYDPETVSTALIALIGRTLADAGPALGLSVSPAPVRDAAGIEKVAAALAREPGGALAAIPMGLTDEPRLGAIVAAAARHRLPLIGPLEIARAGGLMSLWIDPIDEYVEGVSYVDRILRGARPADLPVQQPTRFKLVINLKTAKALGLTVPPILLAQADEVIE